MSMYDKFDRDSVKVMRKAMEAALQPLGARFGMNFEVGNIKFTGASLSAKVECVIGSKDSFEEEEFNRLCERYGLKPHHYKKDFVYGGKTYRVVGFNTKAPKNPFKMIGVDGKSYSGPASIIKNTLLVQHP